MTLQARALTVNNRRGPAPARSHRLVRARACQKLWRQYACFTRLHNAPFRSAALFGASLAIGAPVPACANVITDWDDKALVLVTPMTAVGATSPYMAQRMMAMVHAAMFDAVNSIERRYQPYLAQLPADPATSKEAAAAAAAAALLATIDEKRRLRRKPS